MKKMLLLGIAAVALVAAAPAHAALTIGNGGTGLVQKPTANTVAPMGVAVAADYLNTDDYSVPVRLELGLIEGLELGGLFSYNSGDDADNSFGANAKFRIPMEFVEGLGIAAGGSYTKEGDLNVIGVFGVATYGVELEGIALGASAGVDWERWDFDGDDENGVGFFAGIEVGVMEGLSVAAEFGTDHGDVENGTTGLAVRYALPMVEGLTLQAGVTELGDDHEFFVGGQFAIDMGAM